MIRSPFFSIGFRPFFAAGTFFGALALLAWAAFWQLDTQGILVNTMKPFGGFLFWHPHELIMGFALAIIMGFLLTAVRNWTGLETASSRGLLLLLTLWLFARYTMACSEQFSFKVILVSQILPPLLTALFIGIPIIKKQLWRNLFAPGILIIFSVLDIFMLYQVQQTQIVPSTILSSAILLIMILITMIGGRIIPFFTANKLGIPKVEESKPIFLASVIPLVILAFISLLPDNDNLNFVKNSCAGLLFLSHSLRMVSWHHKGIWSHPMLWSLWVFYGALPLGFLFMALNPFFELGTVPLHIMAVGTMCGLIVSMVSRVSLGHTGRIIKHDAIILIAFAAIGGSVLLRTLAVGLLGMSTQLIILSAVLAAISLSLIFMRFIYVWMTPRPDGK